MLGHLRSCRSCRGRPRGGRVGSGAAHLVVSLGRRAPVTLTMRLVFPKFRLGARRRFNRLGPRPSVASRDSTTSPTDKASCLEGGSRCRWEQESWIRRLSISNRVVRTPHCLPCVEKLRLAP